MKHFSLSVDDEEIPCLCCGLEMPLPHRRHIIRQLGQPVIGHGEGDLGAFAFAIGVGFLAAQPGQVGAAKKHLVDSQTLVHHELTLATFPLAISPRLVKFTTKKKGSLKQMSSGRRNVGGGGEDHDDYEGPQDGNH